MRASYVFGKIPNDASKRRLPQTFVKSLTYHFQVGGNAPNPIYSEESPFGRLGLSCQSPAATAGICDPELLTLFHFHRCGAGSFPYQQVIQAQNFRYYTSLPVGKTLSLLATGERRHRLFFLQYVRRLTADVYSLNLPAPKTEELHRHYV